MFPITRKFMNEKMGITEQMIAVPFVLLALDDTGGEEAIPLIPVKMIEYGPLFLLFD